MKDRKSRKQVQSTSVLSITTVMVGKLVIKRYNSVWHVNGFFFQIIYKAMEPSGPLQTQPFIGGTFDTPCRCSSTITLSIEGGFKPRGRGNHGLSKTSPMTASILSFD